MKKLSLIFIIIFLFTSSLFSRESDTEGWSGIELTYGLMKRFDLKFTQELRTYNEISSFKSAVSDIGLSYKFHDLFRVSSFYRGRKVTGFYHNEWYTNLSSSYEILNRIEFTYRFRYHKKWRSETPNEEFLRNKLKLELKPTDGPLKPYLDTDWFYQINNPEKPDRWDKYRITMGLEYKVNKRIDLSFFYRFENELNRKKPDMANILGFYISYELN